MKDKTSDYMNVINLYSSYRHFTYWQNIKKGADKLPKTLVFQGSYLNSRGRFVIGNTSEYIAVHNYQNVLDLDYYYNIFQPECVIFEVAEYTFSDSYFDLAAKKQLDLNPAFDVVKGEACACDLKAIEHLLIKMKNLDELTVSGLPQDARYVYLKIGEDTYDFIRQEDGSYTVTLEKDVLDDETEYEVWYVK